MDDCASSNSFSLYLFLIISLILVSVDTLGVYHIILTWNKALLMPVGVFESCLKWQLVTRMCFASFSLLAALSCFILCVFLIVDMERFTEKMLNTFLYYNYMIFGPYMLGFCVLGLIFWNNVAYMCSAHNINYKFFSSSNAFSLVFSLVISVIITMGVGVYKAINLYVDSVLQKPDGLPLIRKMTLWIALRNTNVSELIRAQNNEGNRRRQQEEDEFSRIRIGH